MDNKIIKAIKGLNEGDCKHICYIYNDCGGYLENLVSFIMTAINDGDHVLLVENDRNILTINKRLQNELSRNQLDNVHYMNNFNFYFSNETFHPQTVTMHFLNYIQPFIENNVSFRTWGHIEWGDDKDIERDIEKYEREVDKLTKDKGIISVCAYPAVKTSDSLRKRLENCHEVVLRADE